MIPLERCCALLLCAGLSRRFGPDNKLLMALAGKPLVAHAADLCAAVPFAARIAVVPPGEEVLRTLLRGVGLALVDNHDPEAGRDHSLRIGLAAALVTEAEGVVVLLGDMPHVTPEHLAALAHAAGADGAAISHDGVAAMPPTLIPAGIARAVLAQRDRPVRTSLGPTTEVRADPALLADYDTRDRFGVSPGVAT